MRHRPTPALVSFTLLTLAACADNAPRGKTYDVGPTPVNDPTATGDVDNPGGDTGPGDSDTPTPFVPPAGAYLIVSPVAASAAGESDRLVASAAFAAEVRVGHVSGVRAVGFRLHWDPAVLALASHAPIDTWLRSNGGAALTGMDRLDPTAGSLAVALAAGGAGTAIATTASEAVLHLELAWVGVPTATAIRLDLSPAYAGILDDASNTPLAGVTTVDLTVTPTP